MSKKVASSTTKETGAGYFIYKDGSSAWGVGILKNNEIPLRGTKELHQGSVADRIAWHKEETANRIEAAKAKK